MVTQNFNIFFFTVFGYFYFLLSLTVLQFSCNIAVDELAVLDLSPSYTTACGWPAPSG